ncbi:major facilitator superfamily domain-containing protein [Polychytrium aggregatum]|uniref:major facilitator superfamily domain-containing protein n=1 Tax=Polychytrium aggregatum TaxID=110093 RepID=UPI0022FEC29E|nr:major facilitator superfamily domain-containing protein [Polychytrium aggregatum]KAI9203463.1 major facilitator superfamily domain-containing protein [Polychytrium aggregatum]
MSEPQHKPPQLSRLSFALIFVGLALALLLAAIDQVIVSSAIPSIGNSFQDFERVPWIGTAYLLTSSAMAPTYGKLSDIFGRKSVFLVAIVIFEIGSLICGVATSMDMLIAGRAIAGIGGGGLIGLVLIIISDLVSFQDRGKYQGIIGAVFGLASIIGPFVGGLFTDKISWRWCFFINLPFGALAILAIVFFLHLPTPEGSITAKLQRIDYLGSLVLISAVICLLLPVQYGGGDWAWNAPQTIALFVAAAVLTGLFIFIEFRVAKEPVIPPSIFRHHSVGLILAFTFLFGAAFLAIVYYLPTYFQIIDGATATQSGVYTIPMVVVFIILNIGSGIVVSRSGHYRIFFWIGFPFMIGGSALLYVLNEQSLLSTQMLFSLAFGIGSGCIIQSKTIAIQASVPHSEIAVATTLTNFAQTLGGVLGIAIGGAFLNNTLQSTLQASSLSPEVITMIIRSPASIRSVFANDPSALATTVSAFLVGIRSIFLSTIPYTVVGWFASLIIREFRKGQTAAPKSVSGLDDAATNKHELNEIVSDREPHN